MNKKERKKLICLYEEYIQNPNDELLKKDAWNFVSPSTHFFTEEVENAVFFSNEIFSGTLTIKKAKEILKELKKEDEEDK